MSDALHRLIGELAGHAPRQETDGVLREAAVALILTVAPDRLLLIRRAERIGDPWSGHLALPGGRREARDGDLLDTAIRETVEETGIVLRRDECVAILDDLAPVSPVLPRLVVRPCVFLVDAARPHVLNAEVAHAQWIGLDELAAPGIYQSRLLQVGPTERLVEGYLLPQGFLWGMTERMVTPVVRRWMALGGSGS